MPIDFSYLDDAAPQRENTSTNSETVSVTIRVDAECLLHCDGEFVDIQLKAGVITKTKLPVGKHLLEFMSLEASGIKVEKAVDFPEVGKNYLVLISDLSKSIEAKKKAEAIKKAELEAEAEAKRKAEEEAQRLAEEAKRKAAEEGAKRIAEEEAKRKAEEEARRKAEEARVKADAEAKRKAEAEAKRRAEEEAKRKAEEEAEAKRKARAEAEAKNGALIGHDYVDLGLPSGLKWATCNVGANSPEEYGDYYAWGELKTKSSYTKENSITDGKSMIDIFGDPTYDVARAKWGSNWRMPTLDEIKELNYECKWEWEDKGYVVTGPNGNRIFLPVGGYCKECASCDEDEGYIWSSTPVKSDCSSAYGLFFVHTFGLCHRIEKSLVRSYGLSVRPVLGQEAEDEAKRKHLSENERNNLCDLVLLHASAFGMLRVLRVLRDTIGISVSGSDLVNTPYVIKRSISKSEAEAFKKQLEEAGAEVEIR